MPFILYFRIKEWAVGVIPKPVATPLDYEHIDLAPQLFLSRPYCSEHKKASFHKKKQGCSFQPGLNLMTVSYQAGESISNVGISDPYSRFSRSN